MPESNFKDNLKVNEKNLVPMEPLDKCLWVMKVTSLSVNLAMRMQDRGENKKNYLNHNYTINQYLGELEYDLRNGNIDKDEFSKKCKAIYDKYDINFDVLKQNLDDLEVSEQNSSHFKENYYKYNYDQEGKRIPSTEFEIEAENFDSKLSNRLEKQTEKFYNKHTDNVPNRENGKNDIEENIEKE